MTVVIEEMDGSSIVEVDNTQFPEAECFRVTTPGSFGFLDVVVVDVEHASSAVAWLVEGLGALRLIGLDTESVLKRQSLKVVLLQLSCEYRCVVVRLHKYKPTTQKDIERVLNDITIAKAGAEIYGDALGLHGHKWIVNGLINLSLYYLIQTSLRNMFLEEFKCNWIKDKNVILSDWSIPHLSLVQIKYAALDAWASYMVGRELIMSRAPPVVVMSPCTPIILERLRKTQKHLKIMREVNQRIYQSFPQSLSPTQIHIRIDMKIPMDTRTIMVTENGKGVITAHVTLGGQTQLTKKPHPFYPQSQSQQPQQLQQLQQLQLQQLQNPHTTNKVPPMYLYSEDINDLD